MANQVKGIPRVPEGVRPNLLLSRGRILDGTIPTFWGPGQVPLAGANPASYSPPTDWRPAGSLIRMPQVVWLVERLYPIDQTILPGPSTGPGVLNSLLPVVQALVPILQSARDTINSLRPGRTWAHLATLTTQYADPASWDGNLDDLVYIPTTTGDLSPVAFQTLVTLPRDHTGVAVSSADFLGTDFMMIYCGAVATRFEPGVPPGSIPGVSYFILPLSGPEFDAAQELAVPSDMGVALPRFRRYMISLYGPPEPHNFPNDDGTGFFNKPPIFLDDKMPEFMQTLPARFNSLSPDTSRYSCSYDGELEGLTVDGLVEQIAANFGFDPETGKDLPVS